MAEIRGGGVGAIEEFEHELVRCRRLANGIVGENELMEFGAIVRGAGAELGVR
jgi:hypothetical protein